MSYEEAMDRYGVDKPDLRFGMELRDVSGIFAGSSFKVFKEVLEKGGIIKALNVKGGGSFSRKEIDELTPVRRDLWSKGFDLGKSGRRTDGNLPIQKFLTQEEMKAGGGAVEAVENDLLLFVADPPKVVNQALGNLRLHLGEKLG